MLAEERRRSSNNVSSKNSSNIFFGNSTSYNHLVTAIQGLSSNSIAARKKILSEEKILVATMDSNQ